MREPRDWDELAKWGRENRVNQMTLRNTLAWLALKNYAQSARLEHRGRVQRVWIMNAVVRDEKHPT